MANFTITVSNTLTFLGGERPTLWGSSGATTMTWGTDRWGAGEDMIQAIGKVIANSLAGATALAKKVTHVVVDEGLTLDSIAAILLRRVVSNTMTFTSAQSLETLGDGTWLELFPGGVTNALNRTSTSYASGSSVTTSFTTAAAASTTWS